MISVATQAVLMAYGDLSSGIQADIAAGSHNDEAVLDQIAQCADLVLWAYSAHLLQSAAALAAKGEPLCDVLYSFRRELQQPVTPETFRHGVRTLRGLRFLGAEPSHAGESLYNAAGAPAGFHKDVFYRTLWTPDPGGVAFFGPGQLATCCGQPAGAYKQLMRIWLGPSAKLGDNKNIGTAIGQNGKTIPDSQPGDIYAIPATWDVSKLGSGSCASGALGNAIIDPSGNIVWFPFGTAVKCPSGYVLDPASGNCIKPKPGQPTVPTCDPATEIYDSKTNTCVPAGSNLPPASKPAPAQASSAGLIIVLLLLGATGTGLYLNEHGKHKAKHAGGLF